MHSSYLQSDPALDTTNTRRYGAEEMGRVRVKKIRRQGDGDGQTHSSYLQSDPALDTMNQHAHTQHGTSGTMYYKEIG